MRSICNLENPKSGNTTKAFLFFSQIEIKCYFCPDTVFMRNLFTGSCEALQTGSFAFKSISLSSAGYHVFATVTAY